MDVLDDYDGFSPAQKRAALERLQAERARDAQHGALMQRSLTPTAADQRVREMGDATLERWAAAAGDLPLQAAWESLTDQQRLVQRAVNERARRALTAQRQADEQAGAARVQGQRDAETREQIDAFRVQARASFPGTDSQFNEAFPSLLRQWQQQQALAGTATNRVAQKRASGGVDYEL